MSDFTDDDDDENGSSSGDFPPVAAVALAVSLTAVLVIVFVIVWRGRKSRRRPEAFRLLYAPGPQKPRIWDRLSVVSWNYEADTLVIFISSWLATLITLCSSFLEGANVHLQFQF